MKKKVLYIHALGLIPLLISIFSTTYISFIEAKLAKNETATSRSVACIRYKLFINDLGSGYMWEWF